MLAAPKSEPSTPPSSSLLSRSNSTKSSPPRSPRRMHTDPDCEQSTTESGFKAFKRIIVFCDGTWQDGVAEQRSQYTNVLRLARSINHEDTRFDPPVMQVVFYQSGIGSDKNLYSEYVEGTTGNSLADKVEEAYAFIAHNFNPGDEIFLFGFSRGAYTARMVAAFIGEIGVLDRKDMDSFAGIFIDFQKLGPCANPKVKIRLEEKLARWRSPDSPGRQRAALENEKFTVKCLGVWETVGSLGLPEEIPVPRKTYHLFGFQDSQLGDHIEAAYQALALNEMRVDFNCNKFNQTPAGKAKHQTLKQCWFAGCHADIGGGYKNHDLADLTLVWMAAHIENVLSLDFEYLQKLLKPVAAWGEQQPNDSKTGVFLLASTVQRTLPTTPNNPNTHESIHPSVLQQAKLNPSTLHAIVTQHPTLVAALMPLEEQIKKEWPYDPNSPEAKVYASELKAQARSVRRLTISMTSAWFRTLVRSVSARGGGAALPGSMRSAKSSSSSGSGSITDSRTLVYSEGHTEEVDVRVDVGKAGAKAVVTTSITQTSAIEQRQLVV
ncbi:hypothetical protein BDZ97DRAFT_2034223 [Flammula alnicola]|nr:hypothetical protein BDZ97DRAFT_2034223 [Flammula alnicola]